MIRSTPWHSPDPLYSPDNVLISIRHQDTVAIFDWKKKRNNIKLYGRRTFIMDDCDG